MLGYVDEFMIVEACAPQRSLVHIEAQWMNEMQPGSDICAQSDDIAGIGWNLRLIENQMEHDNEPLDDASDKPVKTDEST